MVRYQTLILTALLMSFAVLLGFFSSQITPAKMIWGGVAFAVFAVSFVRVEYGLYILIFSMLLSPEVIVGETGGSSLGRGVTLRVEDFLLAVIGFSWFARNAVDKDLGLFLKTPLNKAIFFYALVCVVSTGFGIMGGRIRPGTGFFFVLKYIEYFIVFFMVVNHVKDTAQIRRFVFCLLLTCFIVAIIGMLQIPGGERVSAPFEGESGEPNTFGGYLLFMGMVTAGMLSQVSTTRSKHLLAALLVAILPPFLFTLSRASYLALIPAVITLGYLMNKRAIVVGLILAALLISPLFLPGPVTHRIRHTFEQPPHRDQIVLGDVRLDTSTSARLRSWAEALRDWIRHPLLGYGVTGYKFVDAQLPRVLTETGVLGLAAFLYLLYCIGKLARENLQNLETPHARGICIGFIAGFVGLVFHAVGANTFIIVRIMEPFWFFVGILVVLPIVEREEAQAFSAPEIRES